MKVVSLLPFDFRSYLPFNGQSWDLLVQTQRVGEINLTFPLSVAYHVTQPYLPLVAGRIIYPGY